MSCLIKAEQRRNGILSETLETIFHLISDTRTSIGNREWIGEYSCWKSAMRACMHARTEDEIYVRPQRHTSNKWRRKSCNKRNPQSKSTMPIFTSRTNGDMSLDRSHLRPSTSRNPNPDLLKTAHGDGVFGRWNNQRVENAKLQFNTKISCEIRKHQRMVEKL